MIAEILPISHLNINHIPFSYASTHFGGSSSAGHRFTLPNAFRAHRTMKRNDHQFVHNWATFKRILVNSLSRSIPTFFRHTMIDPTHPVYYQSVLLHGPNGNYARPLSVAYLYQLGLRTMYFLERSAGLRPYVCFVEYHPSPISSNVQNLLKQRLHNNSISTSNLQPTTPSNNLLPQHHQQNNNIIISHLDSSHSITQQLNLKNSNNIIRFRETQNQHLFGQYQQYLQNSPFLANSNKATPSTSPSTAKSNTLTSFPPSNSTSTSSNPNLIQSQHVQSHQQSTTSTNNPKTYIYTLIRENRTRPIKRIIPLSTNPQSIELLPEKEQLIILKIHQYFKQLERNMGGLPLTDQQKLEILSQLSPEIRDILCNQFIINNNHRVEERLLQFIAKGTYMNVGTHSTVPIVIQRHQLVNLLKELQLIVF